MGTFSVNIEAGSADRQAWREAKLLVDTGATFTWLRSSFLRELGHEPTSTSPFELADGQIVERGIAEVPVRIDGKVWSTICVFGDAAGTALLGAVTLEQFLLAPDPIHQKLVPVVGLAMKAHRGSKR